MYCTFIYHFLSNNNTANTTTTFQRSMQFYPPPYNNSISYFFSFTFSYYKLVFSSFYLFFCLCITLCSWGFLLLRLFFLFGFGVLVFSSYATVLPLPYLTYTHNDDDDNSKSCFFYICSSILLLLVLSSFLSVFYYSLVFFCLYYLSILSNQIFLLSQKNFDDYYF